VASSEWPAAEQIESPRLRLEPLRVGHAEEIAPLLDDDRLHEFIGGRPDSAAERRARYTRLAEGRSPDGVHGWLNWIVRDRDTDTILGTVQATVSGGSQTAAVAWVIGSAHQGNGYAKEAAQAMVGWLREHGVERLAARIHPQHRASIGVARSLGLSPTDTIIDGEVEWSSAAPPGPSRGVGP
jgi:RimJ/RimL family protein N-acetyltransferase